MEEDKFPHELFAEMGYQAAVHGQKSWNGVAILSREPCEVTQVGLPGQEELGARLLEGRIGDLTFTTVYCPNGKHADHDDYPGKLSWFDSLADYLRKRLASGGRTLVCGDFNICPSPLDSWNEEKLAGSIFHTEAERERMRGLYACGLTDLFRALYPKERSFSWWDYRDGAFHRDMGLRIDFLLATNAVAESARGVEIDREYRKKKDGMTASDHAPVFADLEA
jgi:exodeoxyribonuclease-3